MDKGGGRISMLGTNKEPASSFQRQSLTLDQISTRQTVRVKMLAYTGKDNTHLAIESLR